MIITRFTLDEFHYGFRPMMQEELNTHLCGASQDFSVERSYDELILSVAMRKGLINIVKQDSDKTDIAFGIVSVTDPTKWAVFWNFEDGPKNVPGTTLRDIKKFAVYGDYDTVRKLRDKTDPEHDLPEMAMANNLWLEFETIGVFQHLDDARTHMSIRSNCGDAQPFEHICRMSDRMSAKECVRDFRFAVRYPMTPNANLWCKDHHVPL